MCKHVQVYVSIFRLCASAYSLPVCASLVTLLILQVCTTKIPFFPSCIYFIQVTGSRREVLVSTYLDS